ncbi:MAG: AAA family ATPase [Halioglobus sp.]
MYYQYFGLNEAPFSIAVNPRYLFMSARHRDALAHLLYGVGSGGGFILLTGEVGTGKTTINRCLLEQLPEDTDIAIILNPALNALELLATACDELGISYDPYNHSLKTLTDKLHAFLLANYARGRNTVLMIDEAQHLDFDVLEQIRLLTNLETNTRKLLQIILIGQPELVELLNKPELRQLNQRITARYNLEPLNQQETAAYIKHRLEVAGLAPGLELFPAKVVRGIYKYTRGIPRLINVLCDRILLGTYGRNKKRADMAMLNLAAREVLGSEPTLARRRTRKIVIVIAAIALLAEGVWLGLWWLQLESSSANTQQAVAILPAAPEVPNEAYLQTDSDQETISPAASRPTPWLLPPALAFANLWSVFSVMPVVADICSQASSPEVACIEDKAETWEELRGLDRPIVLDMVTPERFAASTLLLGIEGSAAYVYTDTGIDRIALAELGPSWSGAYYFLWHPPRGFGGLLTVGDSGPAVAEVAQLFARLDEQDLALTDDEFNSALKSRVSLFQRRNQLKDDGVIGARTLLKLNEQLGVSVTNARARERLAQQTDEAVLR